MQLHKINIIFKEIDLGVGCITITSQRSQAVDFTRGYLEEHFGILTKAPKVWLKYFPRLNCITAKMLQVLPKWKALIWPFQPTVWVAIIATSLVFSTTLYFVANVLKGDGRFTPLLCFMSSLRCLCSQGNINKHF